MGTTPRGWPYPELEDPANVPADIAALANAVDSAFYATSMTISGTMGQGDGVSQTVSFPTGLFSEPPAVICFVTGGSSTYGVVMTCANLGASSVNIRGRNALSTTASSLQIVLLALPRTPTV